MSEYTYGSKEFRERLGKTERGRTVLRALDVLREWRAASKAVREAKEKLAGAERLRDAAEAGMERVEQFVVGLVPPHPTVSTQWAIDDCERVLAEVELRSRRVHEVAVARSALDSARGWRSAAEWKLQCALDDLRRAETTRVTR